MKIQIEITKEVAKHLQTPHDFWDGCDIANDCLRLIQKQIDKRIKEAKQ